MLNHNTPFAMGNIYLEGPMSFGTTLEKLWKERAT